MYTDLFASIDKNAPLRFLIIKTSSLGDIIQAFGVVNYLVKKFPQAKVDWAVEKVFEPIVQAHPLINRAIALDMKKIKKKWRSISSWKEFLSAIFLLRQRKYDVIFDLQGNTKSGALTCVSKGRVKVGFGAHSVREWPNLLATTHRFNVPKETNIRLQNLRLVQEFFSDATRLELEGVKFLIDEKEEKKLNQILQTPLLKERKKVMVCPGSKWENKQMTLESLSHLLKRVEEKLNASFLLVWGEETERKFCEKINALFLETSLIVERLEIPTWQNLMSEVDLVIAVDSSALHLCGTTSTPSFSVFGPSSSEIFKPIGERHFAFQGKCPYSRSFKKTCPILRSCPTGACIRSLRGEEIFLSFSLWWESLS